MMRKGMNITVLITPVHDCLNPITIDSGGMRIDPHCIRWIMNPYDGFALEEALQLKNEIPETKIQVLGIAPPRCESVFRECLAAGADEAIMIWDDAFEESDSYVCASILAAVLGMQSFDLLLSGWKSSDLEHGQMRPILAELLGLPQISSARKVICGQDESRILVFKRTPGYMARISCPLPAMVTMEKGKQLRYPKFPDRRRAKKIPIPVWDIKKIGLKESNLGRSASLTVVGRFTPPKPTKRSLLATSSGNMSAAVRLKRIMSGGLQDQKESKIWECKDRNSLEKVIDHIIKEKMVVL